MPTPSPRFALLLVPSLALAACTSSVGETATTSQALDNSFRRGVLLKGDPKFDFDLTLEVGTVVSSTTGSRSLTPMVRVRRAPFEFEATCELQGRALADVRQSAFRCNKRARLSASGEWASLDFTLMETSPQSYGVDDVKLEASSVSALALLSPHRDALVGDHGDGAVPLSVTESSTDHRLNPFVRNRLALETFATLLGHPVYRPTTFETEPARAFSYSLFDNGDAFARVELAGGVDGGGFTFSFMERDGDAQSALLALDKVIERVKTAMPQRPSCGQTTLGDAVNAATDPIAGPNDLWSVELALAALPEAARTALAKAVEEIYGEEGWVEGYYGIIRPCAGPSVAAYAVWGRFDASDKRPPGGVIVGVDAAGTRVWEQTDYAWPNDKR